MDILVDRIFSLVLLLATAMLPPHLLAFMVIAEFQLVLGTLVVLYIILRDPVAGVIAGLALLVAYFRVFKSKYGMNPFRRDNNPLATGSSLVTDFITPEHLRDAQNNIVSDQDYGREVKGIDGVYGESVWGAQGTDASIMRGYGETPAGEEIRGAK